MIDPVIAAVVALLALAGGFVAGLVARTMWASHEVRTAHDKSARIVAEVRRQLEEEERSVRDSYRAWQRAAADAEADGAGMGVLPLAVPALSPQPARPRVASVPASASAVQVFRMVSVPSLGLSQPWSGGNPAKFPV